MQEINRVHHGNWLNNGLPDKSAALIIADPPYFEVRGAFDFIWESFEQYLEDVERWARECYRVLADNGSLLWYGHARNIAYSQVIFDRVGFDLINNLVWDKGVFMNLEEWGGIRSFAPCSERILYYDKGEKVGGWEAIHADPNQFSEIKKQLDDWFDASGKTLKEACKITTTATHFFGFSKRQKTQFLIPTRETWRKFQEAGIFPPEADYFKMKQDYDNLRQELEKTRRAFSNEFKLQEVLRFSNEQHLGDKLNHDTPKPETLTRALLLTCSKPGDLVLVPFSGSGTECAMAAREVRRFIGYDIDERHVKDSNERAGKVLRSPALF